jgi:hypothetical protein
MSSVSRRPQQTWDDGALALRVSAIGAVVSVRDREDTINCRPPEWGSFDRWDQVGRLAHELLDIELNRLREAFEQRYKGSFKNRPEVAEPGKRRGRPRKRQDHSLDEILAAADNERIVPEPVIET